MARLGRMTRSRRCPAGHGSSPIRRDRGDRARVVAALGPAAARELLEVLDRSDADRDGLIGRLHARSDAEWLAELLMDLEDEVGEISRLRLIEELRGSLGR